MSEYANRKTLLHMVASTVALSDLTRI